MFFTSFCFIVDFYKTREFYGFCNDIGLFDAVFAPLLKGGRFFLATSTLGISGIIPFPFEAFYI